MNHVKRTINQEKLLKWYETVEFFANKRPDPTLTFMVLAILCAFLSIWVPWIAIPLGSSFSGWQLPVDLAWGIRFSPVSYGFVGLLITFAMLAILGIVFFPPLRDRVRPLPSVSIIFPGMLALIVPLVFVEQMIFADMHSMITFANQEQQSLLIQNWLSYSLPGQHIAWQPFQDMISTITDRALLLFQIVNLGAILMALSGIFAICSYWFYFHTPSRAEYSNDHIVSGIAWALLAGLALIILGRAPIANIYLNLSQQSLVQGNIVLSQNYLQIAQTLNTSLALLPETHYIQGQIDSIRGEQTVDVTLWQADQYRSSGDALRSWQTLELPILHSPGNPVLRLDATVSLEMLAEQTANTLSKYNQSQFEQYPLNQPQNTDSILPQMQSAVPWLTQIASLDSTNLYSSFLQGRIQFAGRNFARAEQTFTQLNSLTKNADLLSIDYTYIALCRGNEGDIIGERILLNKAVSFDYGYYNTVAREAQSGLH